MQSFSDLIMVRSKANVATMQILPTQPKLVYAITLTVLQC